MDIVRYWLIAVSNWLIAVSNWRSFLFLLSAPYSFNMSRKEYQELEVENESELPDRDRACMY